MLPLLLAGIVVSAIALIASNDKKKYSDMANAHNNFLKFEQNVSITAGKKKKLIASRQALQKRIVDFFKTKPSVPVPKFYIQGSYKMGTMVIDKMGTYDVDLGIYFLTKPTVEPLTLQKYVSDAVISHTETGVEHKDKCIRVIYKGDFDIDLPVYYKSINDKHPFLATKNKWFESDPKEICDWFDSKKDNNGQLVRLVKYFKAWANNRSKKMPSGIAFSVWCAKNFKPNNRDDIAFYDTAKAIYDSFLWDISCKNPATPGDDFLTKLDSGQKSNFKETFSNLIKDAERALKQDNLTSSCNIWKQQFGEKFPVT